MNRIANIPATVKAVFPMKQNFVKGTAQSHVGNKQNWNVVSKLDAIADGYRTTTTRDNMQDIMAMRRLQPGDDIAFYNKDGDVVYSNYQGSDRLPQEIFYPASQGGADAREQYTLGEGGNSKYPNVTLFGNFQPQIIPLDQPFSYGAGYKPGLSGNSYLMQYDNPSEVINYASYLPDNSSNVGAVNRLPKQIADKIRTREAYTPTYGDTGLYKDSQIQWQQSPIQSQSTKGRSPYLVSDVNNPIYDNEQLGALGLANIDGNLTKVQWENKGAQGVQAVYYQDGNRTYLDLNNPEYSHLAPYKPVFVPHNQINAAFNKPAQYGTTDIRDNYNITSTGKYNKQGVELFRLDRRSIPVDTNQVSSSVFQTPDDALNSINALINQGNARDGSVKEVYYGNTSEPSYNAIQKLAARGGSGKWVDDVDSYSDYNLWKMGSSSYADSMNQIDLENAGYTIDDFPGGIAFNKRGISVDIPGYQTPLGYRNLPPASEFLENAPQLRTNEPRNIQRLIEEDNLARQTPLQRYYVNEYGVIQNPDIDYAGRTPLSVQAYNNTLDTTQQTSLGRWSGGGLTGIKSDRSDGISDPLIGTYKVRMPQGVAYKPVNVNARYQQEIPQIEVNEFIPHENRYDIDYGIIPDSVDENNYRFSNTIPGTHLNQIQGAYLPGLVETGANQFEPQLVPYSPHPDYYDQHLADVRIKLGNEYYPLTREATTTQYLPSDNQLKQQAGQLYGKRKFFKDGSFEEYDNYGSVPSYEDAVKARNNAVYADPNIEGATDIIGALDRERSLIKRLSTVAEQKLPYNITQGVGYDAIDPYGSGKMDMMLLQSNPIYAANARVNITPKYPEQAIDTLENSVLYGRSEGVSYPYLELDGLPVSKIYSDGTPRYDTPNGDEPRILPNRQGTTIGNNSSLNRFISDDEVLKIEREMGIRPVRKQLVETEDGANYYIDADDEIVKASDLAALFDNPNKKLSLEEVMQLLDTKINDFMIGKNAYTQLMNLEPQDEIIINAELGKKQGNRLGKQLQQQGLETNYQDGTLTATGSMNVTTLPGYEGLKLPVQRFKQDNSDLELTNMAKLGRATKEYNRVIKQRENLYGMGVRLPSRLDPVFSPNDDPAEIRLHQLQQEINANPPNMFIGEEIPNPWDTDSNIDIVHFDTVPNTSMSDAYLHKYLAPPNYSLINTGDIASVLPRARVRKTGTIQRFGDSFPELAGNQPRPIGQQGQEIIPDQLVIEQPNINTTESISQSQYLQWLKPGLMDAGLLGVAGLSQYYQQQQKERDNEEMQLRRIYGY